LIRLLYWLAVILEFLLLLAVLLIFIVTDARTIKVLADNTLLNSKFTYQSIEGNFFTGLNITALSYQNRPLFNSATLHWNPLTLLNKKITLQEVDVRGVEMKNVLQMVEAFEREESNHSLSLDFSLSLNHLHLDVNPYVFEGIKFRDFLFEADTLELSKILLVDSKKIDLVFNSDLANIKLKGAISKSRLFVDRLSLLEIDSKSITTLVQRLKRKKRRSSSHKAILLKSEPFIKKIEIKRLIATLKDVTYNPLHISKTKLLISNALIDPYKGYGYQAKSIKLIGHTNFGKLNYKGYIKGSTVYAKGNILLFKELFTRYHLPLNYEHLKKLSSHLKLNHDGVWIDIPYHSKELLRVNSDFNIDVIDSFHKLHYDYSDNQFRVESSLKGKMPYADIFDIENTLIVDTKEGFRYKGSIDIPRVKGLPIEIITHLKGSFYGDSRDFKLKFDSMLMKGSLDIENYERAILLLDSKKNRIQLLSKFFPTLYPKFNGEKFSFSSETLLDFKNFKESHTYINISSRILDITARTKLSRPFIVDYTLYIPPNSLLKTIDKNINLDRLRHLQGRFKVFKSRIEIKTYNQYLNLSMELNRLTNRINRGFLSLEGEELHLFWLPHKGLGLTIDISEIQTFLQKIQKYYRIELPNIKGLVDIKVEAYTQGRFTILIKSPHIEYINKKSVFNIYDIDIKIEVDKDRNIVIKRYAFKIDDNKYESRFFSKRDSYLRVDSTKLIIKKFWINDEISVDGLYDFSRMLGNLSFSAEQFSFKNGDFDFLLDLGLTLELSPDKISLLGEVDMFGNSITYEVLGSEIVEDSDIIIVEATPKPEKSIFDNFILDLKINSYKPLKYLSKDSNVEFFNDLLVLKKIGGEIMVTGVTSITKGYYQLEDKRFELKKSHIYFAGDPKRPLLDIKAIYKKDAYLISIFISGSTEEPIVNFTSEPYLTQQEILSLILFDGTGSTHGAEAYTLLGGTFAKGLIKSLGINVDHLLLGTDNDDNFSFEIGRRISKDVTVMYQHEDGRDGVKVRMEHNKNFETDIIIQPPKSSSIEFLYKYSE